MKKLYYLIILTVILGLVLTGCLLSNVGQVPTSEQSGITYLTKNLNGELYTEENPFTTDLKAGQNTVVGEVRVWNDAENLHITYVIDAPGWYLTETHLHVDCRESDIPQNKKGNPRPGKFEFGTDHEFSEEVTKEPFVISLDDIVCCNPVIAAHAVVCKIGEEVQEFSFVSNNETLTAGWTNVDPESDPLNPAKYGGDDWVNAVDLSSPNSSWYSENTDSFLGAYWISTYDVLEGPVGEDSWRLFKEDFNIPSEAVNISATLHMAADNAVKAYLNGVLGGGTDLVFGSEGYPGNIGSQPYYFKTDQGPFYPDIQPGDKTLAFVVRNWFGSGTNPTGLLYKLDCSYQLLECETAWGDGDRFVEANDPDDPGVHGGGNWATYFTYPLQPVRICADFSGLAEGASVEGLGTVDLYLNIHTPDGNAVKIVADPVTNTYGAFGAGNTACGDASTLNGGIADGGGFSNVVALQGQDAHSYTFEFSVPISEFSLHMLDYGDWNPSRASLHLAMMKAYNNGGGEVDEAVISYTSDGLGNPRVSDYGDLLCNNGDALTEPGGPGNWTWVVLGVGITKVELTFPTGYDPGIGFDNLCFTIYECVEVD